MNAFYEMMRDTTGFFSVTHSQALIKTRLPIHDETLPNIGKATQGVRSVSMHMVRASLLPPFASLYILPCQTVKKKSEGRKNAPCGMHVSLDGMSNNGVVVRWFKNQIANLVGKAHGKRAGLCDLFPESGIPHPETSAGCAWAYVRISPCANQGFHFEAKRGVHGTFFRFKRAQA